MISPHGNQKDLSHKRLSFIKALSSTRMLVCVANGFAAGMPLYYLLNLIPAWLRDSDVDLKTIGLFSLISLPYTWKFFWSPLMDRFSPFCFGRRRGWMLLTQLSIMICMMALAAYHPRDMTNMYHPIIYLCGAIAFLSASQDIVLDAYRREFLTDEELGIGNAMYINGYRMAVFIPGGLGVALGGMLDWSYVHIIIASFMIIPVIKTLVIKEPEAESIPRTFSETVIDPFREFFSRPGGIKGALLVLGFIMLYKLGDNMATALSTPFYLDTGYTLENIGSITKIAGFWSMMAGGMLGGWLIYTIGINRSLYIFGAIQSLSILGFALLSLYSPNIYLLGAVHSFEYIGVGLGTSGLAAFMARESNMKFTASQFALLSSFMAIPRTLAGSATGFMVEGVAAGSEWARYFPVFEGLGWTQFFIVCALLSLPGLVTLLFVAPWNAKR